MIRIAKRTTLEALSGVPAAWRRGLPTCQDAGVVLREVQPDDAPSLLAHLATDEVSRFISPPPTTIAGFDRFISWSLRDREAGRSVCFAGSLR